MGLKINMDSGQGSERSAGCDDDASGDAQTSTRGPRRLEVRWVGPIPYRQAYHKLSAGLYVVYAGHSLIYVDGASDLCHRLTDHINYGGSVARGRSLTGRALLGFARNYRQRLSVKLGAVIDLDAKARVTDARTLSELVNAFAVELQPPAQAHGRDAYRGLQHLVITNSGKHWPMPPSIEALPSLSSASEALEVDPRAATLDPHAAAVDVADRGGDVEGDSGDDAEVDSSGEGTVDRDA